MVHRCGRQNGNRLVRGVELSGSHQAVGLSGSLNRPPGGGTMADASVGVAWPSLADVRLFFRVAAAHPRFACCCVKDIENGR